MVNGPVVVEAKPRVALPFGLFSVLDFRESQDPHWINGIEWQALTCDPALSYDVVCEDPDEDPETARLRLWVEDVEATGNRGNASAFSVYGFAKCGLPGGRDLQKGEEEATAHLLSREEAEVEAQTWSRMSAEATDLNPAGAVSPSKALAILERWMGSEYGSLGAIHADRGAATLLADHIANQNGPRLLTKIGTPVVAGAGYPGTSPAGVLTADVAWVYASPALFGYRGPVYPSDREGGFDRGTNDHYAVASRGYVVGFDPC